MILIISRIGSHSITNIIHLREILLDIQFMFNILIIRNIHILVHYCPLKRHPKFATILNIKGLDKHLFLLILSTSKVTDRQAELGRCQFKLINTLDCNRTIHVDTCNR